ncbi:helix-turn-helix domain-containing protein [Parapedobacter soli]|uniref:helix-turn-helix domain-containing protein n=1 Tax=Parapedobacter soli TaxID=416955 RepID=UPI0021C9DB15|nr:helix-turn-helix domain-containing protein [Parapedobacter soli]
MQQIPNPFEAIDQRIGRLESMMATLIDLTKSQARQQPAEQLHDRRKPATREIAAEYLGVSVGTVDNLVRSKQLKACRVGKAVRFRWEALDEFINKRNK